MCVITLSLKVYSSGETIQLFSCCCCCCLYSNNVQRKGFQSHIKSRRVHFRQLIRPVALLFGTRMNEARREAKKTTLSGCMCWARYVEYMHRRGKISCGIVRRKGLFVCQLQCIIMELSEVFPPLLHMNASGNSIWRWNWIMQPLQVQSLILNSMEFCWFFSHFWRKIKRETDLTNEI